MSRVCQSSGKRTTAGRSYTTRGLAKSKGGIGLKCTGVERRKFKPNIQKIRILLPNGAVQSVRVAASEIRSGKLTMAVDGVRRSFPLVKVPRGHQKRKRELAKSV